jgi:hypothetical protein
MCVGESPWGFPARGTAKPKSELRGRVGPSRSVSDGLWPSEVQRTMICILGGLKVESGSEVTDES